MRQWVGKSRELMSTYDVKNAGRVGTGWVATGFLLTYNIDVELKHIGARIRRAREAKGMSQAKLAALVGVPSQSISAWERGEVVPGAKNILRLAEALGVSVDWLLTGQGRDASAPSDVAWVPVYEGVPAGPPYDPGDPDAVELVPVPRSWAGRVFGVRVRGDSMEPTIKAGDTVIVAVDVAWDDGDVVLVRLDGGEYTLKRLRKRDGVVMLIPDNPSYEPIVVERDRDAGVVGVVVAVLRTLKKI